METHPSNRTLINKVTEALSAVRAGKFQIGLTKHLVADLEELELESQSELIPLVTQLLEELQKAGPKDCYVGGRPPHRSYEQEINNLELWAYAWHSGRLGYRVYLKFALKKGVYIYVDCHPDRPKNEGND